MTQTVTLLTGTYDVRCQEEPYRETVRLTDMATQVDTSWTIAHPNASLEVGSDCTSDKDVLTAMARVPAKQSEKVDGGVELDTVTTKPVDQGIVLNVSLHGLPDLATASASLASAEGGSLGGRSLDGTAPAIVQDTLSLLAEIAVERAKSRAFKIIHDKLVSFVCTDLKIPRGLNLPWEEKRLILPATCEAVRGITLPQLAEAAPVLTRALDRDLVSLALDAIAQSDGSRAGYGVLVSQLAQDDSLVKVVHELEPDKWNCPRLTKAVAKLRYTIKDGDWFKAEPVTKEKEQILKGAPDSVDLNGALMASVVKELAKQSAAHPEWSSFIQNFETSGAELDSALKACGGEGPPWDQAVQDVTTQLQAEQNQLEAFRRAIAIAPYHRDLRFVLDQLEMVVGESITSGRAPSPRMMQTLLISIAQHSWDSQSLNPAGTCAVQLAFATMATCHAMGNSCDARAIGNILRTPKHFFSVQKSCESLFQPDKDEIIKRFPELPSIVTRGLDLVSPPPEISPERQIQLATAVTFDVLRLLFREKNPQALSWIGPMESLTLAALEGDPQAAIQQGSALVHRAVCAADFAACIPAGGDTKGRTLIRALDRTIPIVTALASNSESLKQAQESPDQAKALRDARKQTLESLIDASTDRSRRSSDTIVSLGTMVGPNVRLSNGGGPMQDVDKLPRLNLGLPMGIALQRLPVHYLPEAAYLPSHFMVSFVDLGTFLHNTDDKAVQWNDFVALGAQVGWTLAVDPGNVFSFGVDAHYFPVGRFAGNTQVRLYLGYYVPFFDFN